MLFEQAISQAPNTLLSFASIFTSHYVSTHGVNDFNRCLADSALTLAEVLKIYNYRTAAFLGGVLLNPIYRLDQGFDNYFYVDKDAASFTDILPGALEWIKQRRSKQEKFFLLLHGDDLHTPYSFPVKFMYDKDYNGILNDPTLDKNYAIIYKKKIWEKDKKPISLSDRDIKFIVAQYDEGINYVDRLIGGFLNELETLKLIDKTIIILTADHGEGLFDHDWFFHEFNLYDSTIRVPLIIKIPFIDAKRKRITPQVQLIDLMPTILELAGIEVNRNAEGHSLLPLLTGEAKPGFDQYAFTESIVSGISIRSEKWKLIYGPDKVELFNLKADPEEEINLIKQSPEIASHLTKELLGWLKEKKGIYNLSQELPDKNEPVEHLKEKKKMINEFYENLK
jgi:arylsulfatase A-like enzyme